MLRNLDVDKTDYVIMTSSRNSYVTTERYGAVTVGYDMVEANNQTYIPIEALEEKKDEGVGIEITITLTIGLLLFIINGAAFLNLAWKKRTAQKQKCPKGYDFDHDLGRCIKKKNNRSKNSRSGATKRKYGY